MEGDRTDFRAHATRVSPRSIYTKYIGFAITYLDPSPSFFFRRRKQEGCFRGKEGLAKAAIINLFHLRVGFGRVRPRYRFAICTTGPLVPGEEWGDCVVMYLPRRNETI